jgi:hypothetical protein
MNVAERMPNPELPPGLDLSLMLHLAGWCALVMGAIGIAFGVWHAVQAGRAARRHVDGEAARRLRAAAFAILSGIAIAAIPTLVMIVPEVVGAVGSMSTEAADNLWKTSIWISVAAIAINLALLAAPKRRREH